MSVYDKIGNVIGNSALDAFSSNMHLDYNYDESGSANYTVLRIFKNRLDGTKQYPFLLCPNGTGARTQSALEMNKIKKFPIAINAGIFDMNGQYDSTLINGPMGVTIENGVLIRNDNRYASALTIDSNGDLAVGDGTNPAGLISSGIVSACIGIGGNPIIQDYVIPSGSWITDKAQRQIIGQFGNGDYAIITCEGRSYDHSDGWTIPEAQAICLDIGLKFAFNLDGGGSTETVIGEKQINSIYEGTYGRAVPTYIVFNGTDTFKTSM